MKRQQPGLPETLPSRRDGSSALSDPAVPSAQFPSLQSKMRVVLRVEVEAVKFLKEEPNRLDGLLKRCKTVTDTLTQIRR